jgi:hypothetical protein
VRLQLTIPNLTFTALPFIAVLHGCATVAPSDVELICDKLIQCTTDPVTPSTCQHGLRSWIIPPGCAQALQAADCATANKLWADTRSGPAECWSPCMVPSRSSDSVRMTTCTMGKGTTVDCVQYCAPEIGACTHRRTACT